MSDRTVPMHTNSVRVRCPHCDRVQDAVEEYYKGDPFWTYIHICIQCKYVICESEWNIVTPAQEILYGDGDRNGIPPMMGIK